MLGKIVHIQNAQANNNRIKEDVTLLETLR